MRLTRTIAALAGTVAFLAACGGPQTDGGADASGDAACREITHALGTACVPAEPERIVVLDPLTVLPTLLELDIPVVGAPRVYPAGDPFPDFLPADRTADITLVGDMQQPDLEAIAALSPDLIIGATPLVQPAQAELERIAPTVAIRYAVYQPDWADDVRLVGDTVGRRDAVDQRLAELDTLAGEVRTAIAAGDGPTLSRVDVFQGAPLYYSFGCTWIGQVLGSAGVRQPDTQKSDCTPGDYGSALTTLSPEEISVLDADAIVTYQQQAAEGDVGASPLTELERSPLWGQLAAVQSDRVFVLGDAWGLGGSVPAAERVLTDLRDTVFTG